MTAKPDDTVHWCKRCAQLKPKERFLAWSTHGGAAQCRGHCLDCRENHARERAAELVEYRRHYHADKRSLKRERNHQRRKEVKAAIDKLKDVPCVDCNKCFPPVAMDFDHLGTKTKSVAAMVSQAYKLDLILEEIKHCEIVCACCHRVRTARREQNRTRVKPQVKLRKASSDLSEDILAVFSEKHMSLTVEAVRKALDARYSAISRVLRHLAQEGKLVRLGRGVYRLPEDNVVSPVAGSHDPSTTDRALASMPQRARILTWFAMNPTAVLSTAELSSRLTYGDSPGSIVIVLSRLREEGRLVRVSRSLYRMPTKEESDQPVTQKITPSMQRARQRLDRLNEAAARSRETAVARSPLAGDRTVRAEGRTGV